MSHRTADERYLISLYEESLRMGEIGIVFNRYAIGQRVNIHPKGCDTICRLLIQANFVKKHENEGVYLTPHGEQLALRLLSE